MEGYTVYEFVDNAVQYTPLQQHASQINRHQKVAVFGEEKNQCNHTHTLSKLHATRIHSTQRTVNPTILPRKQLIGIGRLCHLLIFSCERLNSLFPIRGLESTPHASGLPRAQQYRFFSSHSRKSTAPFLDPPLTTAMQRGNDQLTLDAHEDADNFTRKPTAAAAFPSLIGNYAVDPTVLGVGNFATVRLGTHIPTGEKVNWVFFHHHFFPRWKISSKIFICLKTQRLRFHRRNSPNYCSGSCAINCDDSFRDWTWFYSVEIKFEKFSNFFLTYGTFKWREKNLIFQHNFRIIHLQGRNLERKLVYGAKLMDFRLRVFSSLVTGYETVEIRRQSAPATREHVKALNEITSVANTYEVDVTQSITSRNIQTTNVINFLPWILLNIWTLN